jgi:hypothetical protein
VKGSSLDVGDGLVDLEHLGDRNAALGAEIVGEQAEIRGGNTIRNVVTPYCVTAAVTKSIAAVTTFRSFLILLPPPISAWVTTSSAPRAALRWRRLSK